MKSFVDMEGFGEVFPYDDWDPVRMKETPSHKLFVSLGTSAAIVPEAFLYPDRSFCEVHVLTTETPSIRLIQEFFGKYFSNVKLTITRVAGFEMFQTETDHFLFEEVLFRWVLSSGSRPSERVFCLSGGYKTISAAMQQAAALFGADEVFHVLADRFIIDEDGGLREPNNSREVMVAFTDRHLHWIRLGAETGWPQFRKDQENDYPLNWLPCEEQGVRRAEPPDQGYRQRIREVIRQTQQISKFWDDLPSLPFPALATWSDAQLAWLRQPLAPDDVLDQNWVNNLPKVELHCHLGGFATRGRDLETVRQAAEYPKELPALLQLDVPSDWPMPGAPIGLETYRALGDNNGSRLLKDAGCLDKQCRLLYRHLMNQRVVYAEIRCSPANYATEERSPWNVLEIIQNAFASEMQEAEDSLVKSGYDVQRAFLCHVNLIITGTRRTTGDFRSGIARHLALAVTAAEHWIYQDSCRVVGVDLAGFEDEQTRAHYFSEQFNPVHRCGLALTVHAGENDDAEGVWRAVFDLNARRLGHALSLWESPELLRSITDRGIGIEICPYANHQIRGFRLPGDAWSAGRSEYPMKTYLDEGARVSVNTDNIGISSANLSENLLFAARLCPQLTRLQVLELQRNAVETAFISAKERLALGHCMGSLLSKP